MPKPNSALLAKLRKQKQGMSGNSRLIDNKNFSKGLYRMLPITGDDLPGKEYVSLYCPLLDGDKKSSTSPEAFGLPCPVLDAYNTIMRTGSKNDKEHAKEVVRISREYWTPVWDRDNLEAEGATAEIQILRAKQSVYKVLIDAIIDEDDGEDITDPKDGRDFRVRKEGKGLDTEWITKVLDQRPLHSDPKVVKKLVDAAANVDVAEFFWRVNLDVLADIYVLLTGEDGIPQDYLDAYAGAQGFRDVEGDEDAKEEAEEEAEEEVEEEEAEEEAEEEEEAEAEDGEVIIGETWVEFDTEDGTAQGLITGEDGDNYDVAVDGDTEDEWSVPADECTIIDPPESEEAEEAEEEEEPEEEEEEPEEVPAKPAPKKKAPAKKTPAKTPAKKTPAKGGKVGGTKSIRDRVRKSK